MLRLSSSGRRNSQDLYDRLVGWWMVGCQQIRTLVKFVCAGGSFTGPGFTSEPSPPTVCLLNDRTTRPLHRLWVCPQTLQELYVYHATRA